MAQKRAFISFDYDHDEGAKIMLAGQAKLPDSPFDFKDASVKDHLTGDWKEKVRRRMDNVDVLIVLCGEEDSQSNGRSCGTHNRTRKEQTLFSFGSLCGQRLHQTNIS